MKKIFKALKFPIVFTLFLSSLIACDKDFSVVKSAVLGEGNANFSTSIDTISVIAYKKKLEALQINNLPSNLLGVFNDPEYGKTTASIITQLTPTTFNADFGVNPVIDSVVINIPYFSIVTGTDSDNTSASTYSLDSVYGEINNPIKLTIYQNNYFLRDVIPPGGSNSSQNYFSKAQELTDATHNYASNGSQTIDFDNHLGEIIYKNDAFKPSTEAEELWVISATDTIKTFVAPALRISFESEVVGDADEIAFWQQTIISKSGETELSNANEFKNYFRGLYFKAEKAIVDDGNMVLMNMASSEANVTIYYSNGEEDARTQAEYILSFAGNKLNTFINDFIRTLEDGDMENGDETLYLKGMEGSMAVVNLFGTEDLDGNSIPDELDKILKDYRQPDPDNEGEFFRDNKTGNYVLNRLINEAHLVIYEDETKVESTVDHTYDRIYAYDVKNNTTLIDYADGLDPTGNSQDPLFSKIFSLGQRDSISPTEAKYKIRITEHINNIIQNDSTNYTIGLVLSNNVNVITNSEILNSTEGVTVVPTASIITPRGTILHGSNAIDVDKRLTLNIFFTEAKED